MIRGAKTRLEQIMPKWTKMDAKGNQNGPNNASKMPKRTQRRTKGELKCAKMLEKTMPKIIPKTMHFDFYILLNSKNWGFWDITFWRWVLFLVWKLIKNNRKSAKIISFFVLHRNWIAKMYPNLKERLHQTNGLICMAQTRSVILH